MKLYVAALCALTWSLLGPQAAARAQCPLLIGINTYPPAGTYAERPASCTYRRSEPGVFENLDGALNDAHATADLLTNPKFGFPAANVVQLTNPLRPLHGLERISLVRGGRIREPADKPGRTRGEDEPHEDVAG